MGGPLLRFSLDLECPGLWGFSRGVASPAINFITLVVKCNKIGNLWELTDAIVGSGMLCG
jgi:hypothetical protein